MNTRVLLTGATGQLGRELVRSAPPNVALLAVATTDMDLTREDEVHAIVTSFRPQVIINAAAYTRVDQAESEAARAYAVNDEALGHLARAAAVDTRILHVSTDFVFDGRKTVPYEPHDTPNPLNVYGASKLAGEKRLLAMRPDTALVLRTSWVYAPHGANFLLTMLRLMQERDTLSIVHDQRGTPTSVASLARVLWRCVEAPEAHGIFHWSDAGEATWFEFANAIHRQARAAGLLTRDCELKAITTGDYPTPARRPAYSVLDKTSTCAHLGVQCRPWQEELQEVLSRLGSPGAAP